MEIPEDKNAVLQHDLEALAAFVERHPRLLVLTGAGISTASGIPDYRDRHGVRRGAAPVEGPAFRNLEAVRKRYWARSMLGYPSLSNSAPNDGHRAIAALEAAGRRMTVLTQNVDGLHQRAGSTGVIELHGNIHGVVCLACATHFSRAAIQVMLEAANPAMLDIVATPLPDGDARFEPDALAAFEPPCCPECRGMLQPDVVFFGDGVPRERAAAAERALEAADAVLVVGSSLVVFSGYRFCRMAAAAGKPVAAINRGITRADHLLAFKSESAAETILPALARWIGT
ncbi:MAG TPA: NAD-dependent protein deacetylase [Herbaspirillum sp.]|jgi:NAD-dependent SIR2 family protein deacetylase